MNKFATRTKDRGRDVKNEYELLVTVVKDIKYAHFYVIGYIVKLILTKECAKSAHTLGVNGHVVKTTKSKTSVKVPETHLEKS